MKNTRKLICALLAALLLILATSPAYAVSIDAPKNVYLDSKTSSNVEKYIYIYGLGANTKVTNIKSNNTKVLKPSLVGYNTYTWEDCEDEEANGSDRSADINFTCYKTGTATVSFKIDGKTYSRSITVLGYANPIKSLVITGISKANLKSTYAKKNTFQKILKSNAKAGQIKVSAASGWKVKIIGWYDWAENGENRYSHLGSGASSAKLTIPKMSKKGRYTIWIEFYNTKTKTELRINYEVGKNN